MSAWLKAHYGWVAAGLAYVAVFAAGYWAHVPKPRTITVVEEKERVVVHQVEVERPYTEYRDRVITKVVTRPDGTRTETKIDEHKGKDSQGSETTTDSDTRRESHVETVTAPEGRWSVRVLAGVNTLGGVVAGAGAEYRLVGPLTLGAWATAPLAGNPSGFTVGLSAGLRLP